jgi:hypothetical protein
MLNSQTSGKKTYSINYFFPCFLSLLILISISIISSNVYEVAGQPLLNQQNPSSYITWEKYKDPAIGVTLTLPSDWIVQPFSTGKRPPELEQGFRVYSPDQSVLMTLGKLYPNQVPFRFQDVEINSFKQSAIDYFRQRNPTAMLNHINYGELKSNPPIVISVISYALNENVAGKEKLFVGNDGLLYYIITDYTKLTNPQYLSTAWKIQSGLAWDFTWESQLNQKVSDYWSTQMEISKAQNEILDLGAQALHDTAESFAQDNKDRIEYCDRKLGYDAGKMYC